jgi:hypothetical protein
MDLLSDSRVPRTPSAVPDTRVREDVTGPQWPSAVSTILMITITIAIAR